MRMAAARPTPHGAAQWNWGMISQSPYRTMAPAAVMQAQPAMRAAVADPPCWVLVSAAPSAAMPRETMATMATDATMETAATTPRDFQSMCMSVGLSGCSGGDRDGFGVQRDIAGVVDVGRGDRVAAGHHPD